jgi:hypothetical protein
MSSAGFLCTFVVIPFAALYRGDLHRIFIFWPTFRRGFNYGYWSPTTNGLFDGMCSWQIVSLKFCWFIDFTIVFPGTIYGLSAQGYAGTGSYQTTFTFAAFFLYHGGLAKANWTPFDIPEAESARGRLRHQYSGMRFLFFFLPNGETFT